MQEAETNLSPNKRPKLSTEIPISQATEALDRNSKGKGKAVADDIEREPNDDGDEDEDDTRTCGICFAEEGARSIRGEIDSCRHYFCFVCIMEWSKVESRCPLCKQRFMSIRRPPVEGFFPLERIVHVPERNQVYHPLGNASEGPLDPYADTHCSYCQNSSNENLLLLCDLCDSAAHTYCVGLGCNVPEGDWFCADCLVTKKEHSKTESDDDSQSGCLPERLSNCCTDGSSFSISEIVSDQQPCFSQQFICSTESQRTRHNVPAKKKFDVAFSPNDSSSHSENLANGRINTNASVSQSFAGETARTLRRCRDVYGRIQSFREKWNELRSGSLTFGLTCIEPSRTNTGKKSKKACKRKYPKDPSISRQKASPFLAVERGMAQDMEASQVSAPPCSSSDVDRAWKMMEAAKVVQSVARHCFLGCKEKKHGDNTCDLRSKKNNACGLYSKEQRASFASEKGFGTVLARKDSVHDSYVIEKTKLKLSNNHVKRQDINTFFTQRNGINMAKKLQMQSKCQETNLTENRCLTPANLDVKVTNKRVHDRRDDHISDGGSTTPSCDQISCVSLGYTVSDSIGNERVESLTHEKKSFHKEKIDASKDDPGNSIACFEAKSEVQSIVKLNMKLQRINKCLGSEGFKKVARVATHTILAACGLEHSESIARKVPKEICKHSEQIKLTKPSTLMPSSCRECFYAFARDVVASISSELMTEASQ